MIMDISTALSILANLLITFLIYILKDLKSDVRSMGENVTRHVCDYRIHRLPEEGKK